MMLSMSLRQGHGTRLWGCSVEPPVLLSHPPLGSGTLDCLHLFYWEASLGLVTEQIVVHICTRFSEATHASCMGHWASPSKFISTPGTVTVSALPAPPNFTMTWIFNPLPPALTAESRIAFKLKAASCVAPPCHHGLWSNPETESDP